MQGREVGARYPAQEEILADRRPYGIRDVFLGNNGKRPKLICSDVSQGKEYFHHGISVLNLRPNVGRGPRGEVRVGVCLRIQRRAGLQGCFLIPGRVLQYRCPPGIFGQFLPFFFHQSLELVQAQPIDQELHSGTCAVVLLT